MPGQVKIISGDYKHRAISTPGGDTHPMGERERNALFNMLTPNLAGAVVADLYAGSGALGLEALSRGAKECLFVEKSHVAMRTLVDNCVKLNVPEAQVAFYRGSVGDFCQKITHPERCTVVNPAMAADFAAFPTQFDIILADPPYTHFDTDELKGLTGLLSKNGVFALSHPGQAPDLPGLELVKTTEHAAAHLSLYARSC